MIEIDRRNYRIAILCSLIFHGALLLAFLPSVFSPKPITVDMLPVGVVEIAAGSGKPGGDLQIAGNTNANQNNQPAGNDTQKTVKTVVTQKETVKKPEEKKDSTRNVVNNKANADKDNSIATNKGDKQADAVQTDTNQKNTGRNETNDPNTGGGGTNGGTGNGAGPGTGNGSGSGIGLGTGEGKVSRMGPAPPYPKNAMNEGKEGEVRVRILVMADGGLEQVNLLQSSGDDRLDRAAVGNIERAWKFASESHNYYIDLIFVFSINNGVSIKFVNSQTRP